MNKKEYIEYASSREKKSMVLADCFRAYLTGGIICVFSQGLFDLYYSFGLTIEDVRLLVPVTIILISVVLTAFGVFDRIARFGGAGTLVPISGFANAVVSPALDTKAEGWILGVGSKIFTIAGPVILYGSLASVIYGVILWLISLV